MKIHFSMWILFMFDDSTVPKWADNTLTMQGLGFERAGLKALIWSYFDEQFASMDCSMEELNLYFSYFVEESIKNGDVAKAIKLLKENPHLAAPRPVYRPARLSMLVQFEDKYADYLIDDEDRCDD